MARELGEVINDAIDKFEVETAKEVRRVKGVTEVRPPKGAYGLVVIVEGVDGETTADLFGINQVKGTATLQMSGSGIATVREKIGMRDTPSSLAQQIVKLIKANRR